MALREQICVLIGEFGEVCTGIGTLETYLKTVVDREAEVVDKGLVCAHVEELKARY